MSRVVLLTFGTYGDVAPYVSLGAALRAAGHDVAVASQKPYELAIVAAGLEYRFLPKDTERATRESPTAQALIDGERMRPSRGMTREMVAQMDGVGPAMVQAAHGAELLLACGPVGSMFGYHIAAGMGIPSIALQLQPFARTRHFAPPVLTLRSFGRLGNSAAWKLAAMGEKIYQRHINEVRTEVGLQPARPGEFHKARDIDWPVLFGFSERVVPRPSDWRPGLQITGYWWPPSPAGFTPAAELVDFLAAGPPPIFVGFGSTATSRGTELSRVVVDAAIRADVRIVMQSGWSRLAPARFHDRDGFRTQKPIRNPSRSWKSGRGPYRSTVIVNDGAGAPTTVFAAGGFGAGNFDWMREWSDGFGGTRVCFEYGTVEPWLPGRPPRRGAERDAAEVRAVADQSEATRAVGVSRGTFAVAGVLADHPGRFDRVVLVIPPAGTAAGRYREWLLELPPDGQIPATAADILILAMRGDTGHPVKVAEDWAGRLGAQLEVFQSAYRMSNVLDVMRQRTREFLA